MDPKKTVLQVLEPQQALGVRTRSRAPGLCSLSWFTLVPGLAVMLGLPAAGCSAETHSCQSPFVLLGASHPLSEQQGRQGSVACPGHHYGHRPALTSLGPRYSFEDGRHQCSPDFTSFHRRKSDNVQNLSRVTKVELELLSPWLDYTHFIWKMDINFLFCCGPIYIKKVLMRNYQS